MKNSKECPLADPVEVMYNTNIQMLRMLNMEIKFLMDIVSKDLGYTQKDFDDFSKEKFDEVEQEFSKLMKEFREDRAAKLKKFQNRKQ